MPAFDVGGWAGSHGIFPLFEQRGIHETDAVSPWPELGPWPMDDIYEDRHIRVMASTAIEIDSLSYNADPAAATAPLASTLAR